MSVARIAWLAMGLVLMIVGGGITVAGAADPNPTVIYRGVSTAVQFDVSPPLTELAQRQPTVVSPGALDKDNDRPTGLEGPLGPQDVDALVQHEVGSGEIPAPSVSFDTLNGTGPTPPDPVGAVGPNHYVVMANARFAVFSKTGTSLAGPANINTLWSGFGGPCQNENAGDPIVLYDRQADRWLLTQFTANGPTFFNCVALSQTPDPTGAYYRWAFSTGTNFPDYPKYGHWPDAYYISTREFTPAGPFAGVGAYALNRTQMIAGNPTPQVISFLAMPGSTPFILGDGLLPADLDGSTLPPAGTPNFYIGSQDNGGPYAAPFDALNIWKFHVDFVTPANSTFTLTNTVAVGAFDSIFPCSPGSRDCIPQPGTTQKIDHLGYRQRPLHRAAYRNFGTHESIVTNQSVEASPGISGIRFWEIRSPNSSPTIFQEGTYAPGVTDGIHRWMGSIAQDQQGNMALGFSASNTSVFPSSRYTGRLVGDALGTMGQGEGSFINGSGSQTGSARWGDYTAMTVDPVDDCTFWYVNEYYPSTSSFAWRLRVGAFKFPSCPPPPQPSSANLLPGFPADFDGDGKTDIAVYRPSTGTWFIINSATSSVRAQQWGAGGDIPVPGDYDGDGKDDITAYRPSTGFWFIIQSSNGAVRAQQWGAAGDVPMPADYDGDGKTDIAVYRPSTGTWFIINSSTGVVRSQQWGAASDRPVPGDYDGDRRTDIAVYRPSTGTWYIINSATSTVTAQQWGAPGDIPVPGDYDGDGKTDIAVFRPSTGVWFIIRSSTGSVQQQQWGAGGDQPLPEWF